MRMCGSARARVRMWVCQQSERQRDRERQRATLPLHAGLHFTSQVWLCNRDVKVHGIVALTHGPSPSTYNRVQNGCMRCHQQHEHLLCFVLAFPNTHTHTYTHIHTHTHTYTHIRTHTHTQKGAHATGAEGRSDCLCCVSSRRPLFARPGSTHHRPGRCRGWWVRVRCLRFYARMTAAAPS